MATVKKHVEVSDLKNTNEDGNQFLSFQEAMKIMLIYGQCLGLLPVSGIFEKDVTKMRPFGGYEASIYLIYTVAFIFSKFLAVSLITSDVHTSSMKAAPALYNIASSMYCEEIQRFLDQVHSDTVALSGFQFFYVTREIILSYYIWSTQADV
ncbi:hypothetical protein O3G_MSEX005266 [Manduca sexta]|uniref:Uncharacterized protein n=1 Tax=Manduca sexta TaxID=7130 RepID=A0A921Z051_MANSE|nr:hypothetical protein O3G_MSEX005266 [Manduca sexta]